MQEVELLMQDIIDIMEGDMDYNQAIEFLLDKYEITLKPIEYRDGNGY